MGVRIYSTGSGARAIYLVELLDPVELPVDGPPALGPHQILEIFCHKFVVRRLGELQIA